jgi:hypothetical protein
MASTSGGEQGSWGISRLSKLLVAWQDRDTWMEGERERWIHHFKIIHQNIT